ncbi:hypothetical protein [Devosia aurantiaca]|uniref:Uncharacterized protein n=1 Tax=Devosia aurantiaca TaxID=2714858 RepID=A0A6M1SX60_9HYPH|nr:hypothetical protein [Devosia aurantiaca]NGP18893.1 hypothetical protein [Devosia aurantiaca]
MNQHEAAQATTMIGMMLKAFPSSQSTISEDSAMAYLYAVDDYSLAAIDRACRLFIKGKVPDRKNPDFAPSAPALAEQCELAEGVLKVEAYEAARVFVEHDSELWRKMETAKDDSNLVSCQRHGKRGWFFLPEEVAQAEQVALPPPIDEAQRLANMARLGLILSTFNSADDDRHDMGQGAPA